jgi:hypothetical protein
VGAARDNERVEDDRGVFTVPDDFDDPLPDDLLAEFEGR